MTTQATTDKVSPEGRGRAARMALEHAGERPTRWAAVASTAAKIGCAAQTLPDWTKAEGDGGKRAGAPGEVAEPLKALERGTRELRQAREIPCRASACSAEGELDRPLKR